MRSLIFFLLTLFCTSCKFRQRVDLIVHNASIYTVDDAMSVVNAMAIADGKIIATGSAEEILKNYQPEEIIDAHQKWIYPGFIDAHCHFTGYATDMWKCSLYGTKSFDEVLERVQKYSATAPAYWIYGRGWDQNDWAIKSYPDKQMLDSLFPDRPVLLKRIDGHAAIVNQKALDLAGINDSTIIPNGTIEKKDGKLTGIITDYAMDMVDHIIPPLSDSLAAKYFQVVQSECFATGLTSVHDCGISEHTVNLIEQEQQAGRLKIKIFALLSDSSHYYDRWIQRGILKTALLHVGGFKIYADGSLGSRGACLLKEYSDKPDWFGQLLTPKDYIRAVATKLAKTNWQLCTHAIGDSANRTVLNIYADVLKATNNRRWRIEHAQVVDSADLELFKTYNIIPSVQPTHATSDMYWAAERLGVTRMYTAYAYQQLLQTNQWMPLGTDFPVEDISPLKTFYAAVFRTDAKGFPANGFQMSGALSREQALRGITIWAAKAAFEENEKGSLEIGKAADFVVLDRDLMKSSPSEILSATVISTFSNGKKVYGN